MNIQQTTGVPAVERQPWPDERSSAEALDDRDHASDLARALQESADRRSR